MYRKNSKIHMFLLANFLCPPQPSGEPPDTLKSAIIHCKSSLVQIAEMTGRDYTQACGPPIPRYSTLSPPNLSQPWYSSYPT